MRHRGGGRVLSLSEIEARRQEREDARKNVLAFVGAPKKKSKTIGDAAFERDLSKAEAMLAAGTFGEATGRHFVALYASLYFRVYGLLPEDMGPKERVYAAKQANLMLEKQFGGDRQEMAVFMAWLWTREKSTEQWRRDNGKDGKVIDWRFQFSPSAVQKYRIAVARKATG